MTRVFDAPRELVWNAWTDPHQVAQWWGPRGFTTTIHEMVVTPGGVWRHTMHGPDGTDYPNRNIFIGVVKPERIVYSLSGGKTGDSSVQSELIWTFEEQHQANIAHGLPIRSRLRTCRQDVPSHRRWQPNVGPSWRVLGEPSRRAVKPKASV